MSPTKVQPAKRLKAPERELEIRLEVKVELEVKKGKIIQTLDREQVQIRVTTQHI